MSRLFQSIKNFWELPWSLVLVGQKPLLLWVVVLIVLVGIADALGLGFFIPLVQGIFDSSMDPQGISDQVLVWAGLFALAFIGRIVLGIIRDILIVHYSEYCQHRLSSGLFTRYVYLPYIDHLNINSGELIKNLLNETALSVQYLLFPFFMILAQGTTLIVVFSLLLAVHFVAAFGGMVVLALVSVFLYWGFKKRLGSFSRQRLDLNKARFRVAMESMAGIREIKLNRAEAWSCNQFSRVALEFSSLSRKTNIATSMPRYAIEGLLFVLMGMGFATALAAGVDLQNVLVFSATFFFATLRLMPAFQTILRSVIQIQSHRESGRLVLEHFHTKGNSPDLSGTLEMLELEERAFIRIDQGFFRYDHHRPWVLENVCATFWEGEFLGITGSSGCGKSTLLDVLCGLLQLNEGRVQWSSGDLFRSLAYVSQEVVLFDGTVGENIILGLPLQEQWLNQCIDIAGIELPLDRLVGERGVQISGGQRQRLGIARTLYRRPGVILMDEATASLDGAGETRVFQRIKANFPDVLILVISHRRQTLELCDRVLYMDKGSIADQGSVAQLWERNESFRSLLTAVTTRSEA